MTSADLAAWAWVFIGASSAFVITIATKFSSRLLKGRSIKEVVDSANAIIQLYENHIGVLETKINSLESDIKLLKTKLDETLAHNEALQKLLLASPAVTLPEGK